MNSAARSSTCRRSSYRHRLCLQPAAAVAGPRRLPSSRPRPAPVCWGPEVRSFAIYLLDRQHLPVERTAELLEDLLGVKVSTGWLCQVQAEAARRLSPFLTVLKDRLGTRTGRPCR